MTSIVINNLPLGVMILNEMMIITDCNEYALDFFESSRVDLVEHDIWTALPELASTVYRPINDGVKKKKPYHGRVHYTKLNKWFELTISIGDSQTSVFIRDVTTEYGILSDMDLYKSIMQNSADAVVVTSKSGNTILFNAAAEQLFGYKQEELIGRNISLLMTSSDASSHHGYLQRYLRTGVSGILGIGPRELVAKRKDGSEIEIELAVSEFHSNDVFYFLASFRDITRRKDLQRKLESLAQYDSLTKLPNRSMLRDRLNQAVPFASRNRLILALFFIDLDGFKGVNDSYGHNTGDKLLSTLAQRMSGLVRSSDTVARMGGDEFVVLLNGISRHKDAIHVAEKFISVISTPVEIEGNQLSITGSIGVTYFPDHGDSIESLMNRADDAMYNAKKAGKNTIVVWSED